MRTTLDLPDDVFKKAKLRAAQEGVALKQIFTRALVRDLAEPADDSVTRRARAARLFAALDQAKNTSPVGHLNREEIHDRPVLR